MESLFEQLGGTYHWEGDYLIPDLALPDEDEQPIGIWGQRHGRWLKHEHRALYDITTVQNTSVIDGYCILTRCSQRAPL